MSGHDPTRLLGPEEAVWLAEIARRFYLEGQPKQDIARDWGITRFKVARLLEQAGETGVIKNGDRRASDGSESGL